MTPCAPIDRIVNTLSGALIAEGARSLTGPDEQERLIVDLTALTKSLARIQ